MDIREWVKYIVSPSRNYNIVLIYINNKEGPMMEAGEGI